MSVYLWEKLFCHYDVKTGHIVVDVITLNEDQNKMFNPTLLFSKLFIIIIYVCIVLLTSYC